MLIDRSEILKGQVCPPEYEANLQALLEALNKFRAVWGNPMIVTSGYRTPDHNATIGGKAQSAHLSCQAADFADESRVLKNFCLANTSLLENCGLWMESPDWTPSWIHLQIRPIPSGNRVFIP